MMLFDENVFLPVIQDYGYYVGDFVVKLSFLTPTSKVNFGTIKQSLRCEKWASIILMTLASFL